MSTEPGGLLRAAFIAKFANVPAGTDVIFRFSGGNWTSEGGVKKTDDCGTARLLVFVDNVNRGTYTWTATVTTEHGTAQGGDTININEESGDTCASK
ncbi:MAG: hypothetical protein OEV92_02255 [Nitrospinota bacterium]|nr:hypothetical protein [Nitrospinota bacterium]